MLVSALCYALLSCSVVFHTFLPHGLQHARLLCLWDSPGKNTEVMLSSKWSSWPRDQTQVFHLSLQGSPRILECVAYPFSRESSQPRNWTGVSCIAGEFFTSWATREAQFLLYSRVNQLYVYMYLFLDFLPIWVTTEHWVEFPVLYSRFSSILNLVSVVYICHSESPSSFYSAVLLFNSEPFDTHNITSSFSFYKQVSWDSKISGIISNSQGVWSGLLIPK